MRKVVVVLVVAGALAGAAMAGGLLLAPPVSVAPGPEPGRGLYRTHCATCHGADGRGNSWRARLLFLRPGSLAGPETATVPDGYLANIIRRGGSDLGKPGMPSFGFELSDREIDALIAYLRALGRVPGPARP